MKIKSGFNVVNENGHFIVKYQNGVKINQIITLDDISLFLWNTLKEREVSKNEMLDLLLKEFEISTVLALGEIDKFVRILKQNGIIEWYFTAEFSAVFIYNMVL